MSKAVGLQVRSSPAARPSLRRPAKSIVFLKFVILNDVRQIQHLIEFFDAFAGELVRCDLQDIYIRHPSGISTNKSLAVIVRNLYINAQLLLDLFDLLRRELAMLNVDRGYTWQAVGDHPIESDLRFA